MTFYAKKFIANQRAEWLNCILHRTNEHSYDMADKWTESRTEIDLKSSNNLHGTNMPSPINPTSIISPKHGNFIVAQNIYTLPKIEPRGCFLINKEKATLKNCTRPVVGRAFVLSELRVLIIKKKRAFICLSQSRTEEA